MLSRSTSQSLNALPPGTVLRDYIIDSELGSGGFSIVYLARHQLKSDWLYAIKEYFPRELAVRGRDGVTLRPVNTRAREAFEDGLRRFRDEAEQLRKFRNEPHIVSCINYCEQYGTAYLVMDYDDGLPLSEFLRRREEEGQPFTEKDVLAVVEPLLAALTVVHRAGVLHRDIKPKNIFVRRKDDITGRPAHPVLLDFGAAKQNYLERHSRSQAPYTPGYAAVEQVSSEGEIGPWTDIYAVGAVMWRMVAGGCPGDRRLLVLDGADGEDGAEVWSPAPRAAGKRAYALHQGLPDSMVTADALGAGRLSPALLQAIDRCLALYPKDRVQGCEELQELLEARAAKAPARVCVVEPIDDTCDGEAVTDTLGAAIEAYNRGEYELALREFRGLAELENRSAQYRLGEMYYYGKGVPESHTQAYQWFTRAAEQGDVDAQVKLGEMYGYRSDGDGPEKHHLEVIKEAESGNDDAQYELGLMYESGNGVYTNDARALQWLTRAAEQGHLDAQTKLGRMYRYNQDNVWECVSEEDHVEALHWYELAAEQGDADAQYESGCIRYDYDGAAEAVSWFKLAADQGHTLAQHSLGCLIADNLVSDDEFEYQNAVKWFIPAAEQGDAVAQYHLGCVLRGEEPDEAGRWFVHAADQGCVDAQYQLGLMCVSGVGVPQDHNQAIQWFARAAKQGHADALTRAAKLGHADSQYDLGHNYEHGVGIPEDQTQAVWWYTLAAEQGHACAQYELGCMSRGGEPDEAVEWFTRAAEQGNADAQHALGKLYCTGDGVPQNHVQAVQWFSGAAKQGHTGAQFELGRMYANGEGVRADNIQAFAWAHLANARGRIGAAPLRDDISANLSQEQLAEAQQLSRELEARIQNSR